MQPGLGRRHHRRDRHLATASAATILDAAARSFAIGFYGGLGERELPTRQGCAAISLESSPTPIGRSSPEASANREKREF